MTRPRSRKSARRGGFTLVETAVSALLVGLLVAAAMQTVGAVFRQRRLTADRMTARLLADQLLAEVLETSYREPDGTPQFGPESGETARALFDDVDDYHGYSETPPKYRDGTAMTQWTGWARDVAVEEVTTSDPGLNVSITVLGVPVGVGLLPGTTSNTGMRKITVTVRRNGTIIATAQGMRSGAWR